MHKRRQAFALQLALDLDIYLDPIKGCEVLCAPSGEGWELVIMVLQLALILLHLPERKIENKINENIKNNNWNTKITKLNKLN
jgi:hypothetical protein